MNEDGIRIQKYLSQQGVASRREIEQWITQGLIKVNGQLAKLGDKISAQDKLEVKGEMLVAKKETKVQTRILIYHKPVGEVCSRQDPLFSKTVFDNLPKIKGGRWVQVGRLDLNTAGLLLFTNDGELANRLMHPKYRIEREYAVRVLGEVTDTMLENLTKGVILEDGPARFKQVIFSGGSGANTWYHVILTEGRQREVRRLWESQGLTVSRLIRIRYGNLELPRTLPQGKWLELPSAEVAQFKRTHAYGKS